jgi:IS4 transposase
VIRSKRGLRVRRRASRAVEQSTGLRSDQTVRLTDFRAVPHYPDPLRRIHFHDVEHHHNLTFLTNNFDLPALTITQLFQARWKVELFFKGVKQHLRIKAFYGTSINAVQTQLWIALSVYVLVAILKKRLDLPHSLYQILQVLSVTLFEKVPILQAFHDPIPPHQQPPSSNQLILIGL